MTGPLADSAAARGSRPRTRVKLCGMFRDTDIDAVVSAAPDYCGFIVDFPKSHRSIGPERLAELVGLLRERSAAAPFIAAVGVFVDKPAADVARIALECGLDAVQLHGHEDADFVRELKSLLGRRAREGSAYEGSAYEDSGYEDSAYGDSAYEDFARGVRIIQAFRIASAADVERACESPADTILLDSGQGSGETFDWSLAATATRPFILAGGLGPDNVAEAVSQVAPWGVDMSSGVETGKLKDPVKMRAAVRAVRG